MIRLVFFVAIALTPLFSKAQLEESHTTKHVSTLKYEPTMPADSTYTITKNTSGQPVSDDVKLEINLHRRKVDYLWRVNGEIEIFILGSN